MSSQETDNQPKEQSLEELTNSAYSTEGIPQLNEIRGQSQVKDASEVEPVKEGETPVPTQEGQATPTKNDDGFSDEEKALLADIRAIKEVSGTPFKSTAELVKAYKEVQSQFTKDREYVSKVKPHEQLLGDMTDPQFANFIQQAAMLYKNPQLASAYVGQGGKIDSPPDPRSYNMYDDSDLAKYQKDLSDYNSRNVDTRINARLGAIEQQAKLEKMKLDLKAAYPDSNPEDIIQWANSKRDWSLVDAYKIREYDNIKAKATEEARKEINKKIETASKTTSPQASGSAKSNIKVEDIISHIGRYGGASARTKFGDKAFMEAMASTAGEV